MWLFLNDAFVSVVADRTRLSHLLVRARLKGDIQRAIGGKLTVTRTPGADYLYRASVPRARFANRVAQLALSIDYPNFKSSVPHTAAHARRSSAYGRVWSEMMALQRQAEPGTGGIYDAGGCHGDDDLDGGLPWNREANYGGKPGGVL